MKNNVLFSEMQLYVAILIVSLSWALTITDNNGNTKLKSSQIPLDVRSLTGDALVEYVNKQQKLFKAEMPASIDELKMKIMKSKYITKKGKPAEEEIDNCHHKIPSHFDARAKWPNCPSISLIRDQSQCGSCWAVSSAEAMSDRVCIASQGNKTIELSADDILSCCWQCGDGCDGGYPILAWDYFVGYGVVSGGLYGTKDACRPYEIAPCGVHPNQTFYGNCTGEIDTPTCKSTCQPGYPISYDDDKTYGQTFYYVKNTTRAIQKEIMANGPVVAAFTVYEDFMLYRRGIYKYVGGDELGGHAVRILGWGEENGVPYWLIANSWNTDWGEDGYFRMLRGTDECGIEDGVVAGQV